ncbi:hypothetical protein GCM10022278_20150 [Allohahella marinimesophila]|uniref:Uncharacterized protein n=1 Tax=Allohahella marinimesophila TaxID=1054972 RepID=A0ABP7P9U0_9GAMM
MLVQVFKIEQGIDRHEHLHTPHGIVQDLAAYPLLGLNALWVDTDRAGKWIGRGFDFVEK